MRHRLLSIFATLGLLALVAVPARASNDEYGSLLWGIRKVGAETAWATGTGAGVVMAIVDTGVDMGHEDLRDNVVSGHDFAGDDADPSDEHGHGTHVAGTAAAVANNAIGVTGVAPQARIMPIRVLNEKGRGSLSTIENGVRYAVDNGAKVVNLSLSDDIITENLTGGTLTDAVNYAWSKGAVAVVSAGNDQLFRTELRQAKAIIVTATTPTDQQAPYATGVGLAPWGIAAPGGTTQGGNQNLIYSTWWPKSGSSRYAYAQGTSMAAPHVSGAAAILLGLGLTPQQAVDRLLSTARDIGQPGNDTAFGHGLLDVAAAVKGLEPAGKSTGSGGQGSGAPGGGAAPSGTGGGVGQSRPSAGEGSDPGGTEATAAPQNEDASGDEALGAEPRKAGRSQLPNIITGAVIVAGAAGAWGYSRIRRLRNGRPPG